MPPLPIDTIKTLFFRQIRVVALRDVSIQAWLFESGSVCSGTVGLRGQLLLAAGLCSIFIATQVGSADLLIDAKKMARAAK